MYSICILNIYDFYNGDIIKQFNFYFELKPCDYFFWNSNLLLVIGYNDAVTCLDIFTGENYYLDYIYDSYIMKKIYLDDCEESIIFVQKNSNIRLLSYKKSKYLINKEKEEFKKIKEKNDKEKEEDLKEKEKYFNLLDEINLGNFY